ncbi:rab-like protein 6 isoform X2 [Ambystoma mexicanum]
MENEPQESDAEMALDAEFLDVYKNCNGVVMMFDITKQWTFNYILRELPKVPTHVPVCVLGNHRDMGEHRVILPDDVRECIQNLNRRPGSSYIRYAESSMRNSFGLKYLHKFFNIPFLQLQRETLLRQLETNQLDIDATLEELSVQQETEDQNYEIFLEMMEARSRGAVSPPATNGQSSPSGSQSPVIPQSSASTDSSSPGTPLQLPQQPPSPASPPEAASPIPTHEVLPPPLLMSPPVASPPPPVAVPQQRRSIMSRLFGSSAPETSPSKPEDVAPADPPPTVQSVEDFVPDESLDRSFLEDSTPQKDKDKVESRRRHDSDSEGEVLAGNPMVAGFQDDLDPDDQVIEKASRETSHIPSNNVVLSSDEEEEPNVSVMADEDFDWDQEMKGPSRTSNFIKPQYESAFTKVMGPKPFASSPPSSAPGENGGSSSSKLSTEVVGSLSLIPQAATGQSQNPHTPAQVSVPRKKGNEGRNAESDSELEGPIATQLLSFVMDDPDFESEDSDKAAKQVDDFPVRDDLSDVSEEDLATTKHPVVLKPTTVVPSFKLKNDTDLFGLGISEKAIRESSDEVTESKSHSKEKKKKKKKAKEAPEEDKTSKKKSKPKKGKEEDKEEKKKRKKKTKENNEFDELEAFLGGGDGIVKARAGGDYEEL